VEGFPSGQRDQTVNLTAQPSKVRILLPPPSFFYSYLSCCGGVPEWPKGSDCKSDGSAFEGSNPSPSTILHLALIQRCFITVSYRLFTPLKYFPICALSTSSRPIYVIQVIAYLRHYCFTHYPLYSLSVVLTIRCANYLLY
jgi:hypothetical protein